MAVLNFSTSDLKKAALRHCGEVDDGTSYYDANGQIMQYLDKAHIAILDGGNEFDFELSKPWSWALRPDPGVLILQPDLTGSISVVNGSALATLGTAFATSLVGYLIQVSDRPDFMKVTDHIAGTVAVTFDAPYAGETGSGFPFVARLIDYDIRGTNNGILRLVQALTVYQAQDLQGDNEQKIYFADENAMAKDYPVRLIQNGTPNFFTILSKSEDGIFTLRFNKSVVQQTRVEYRFIEIPNSLVDDVANYPLIPRAFRDCLAYAASYFLCIDKNDDRSQLYFGLTQQKLKAMQKAEEKQKTLTSKMRGKLIPRGDNYSRGKRLVTQETS